MKNASCSTVVRMEMLLHIVWGSVHGAKIRKGKYSGKYLGRNV